jgi:hypothetical protein
MHTPYAARFFLIALAALLVPACGDDSSTTLIQAPPGPKLSSLALSTGSLEPAFSPDISTYTVGLVFDTTIALTPAAADAGTTIFVNGTPVPSGSSHAVGLTPGSNLITLTLYASNGAQGSYFLIVRQSVQEAYVKASNTEAGDGFGGTTESFPNLALGNAASVAVSGDWMAVGAWSENSGFAGNQSDNSATDSGAVYLFRRVGSVWSQKMYIKAPNIDANDRFGRAVAMDGDTLAVGAPFEDSSSATIPDTAAGSSGAVYIYRYDGAAWNLEAYLKASPIVAGDNFGGAVALQGDVLVVGAIGHDGTVTNSGAAFVFRRSGTTWTQEAVLKASTEETNSFFGTSVALDGDAIVVGGWRETDGTVIDSPAPSNPHSGAAYVFRRAGASWTQEARFQPPAVENFDQFGWSVAISGDVVAVGAPFEESGSTGINGDAANNTLNGAGAVYIFRRSSGLWSQDAYVKPGHQLSMGMNFGTALALRGTTLIVGAAAERGTNSGINPTPMSGSAASGAAFVFRYKGASWSQEAYLKAAVIGDDFFGSSLAFDGQTLVVGAPREDSNATGVNGDATNNSATDSGAVYVFR